MYESVREEKVTRVNPWGRDACFLVPRSSRGHLFLAVFLRVTPEGLSKRETTRILRGEECGNEENFNVSLS